MNAFIIMPFSDPIASDCYEHVTKPALNKLGIQGRRADEIFSVNPILEDIINAIKDASIIIADISGKNPNVFYELGISHILKPNNTIMITHDEYGLLPFDIAHFRIIKYENTMEGAANYKKQLELTINNIIKDYELIFSNEFQFIIETLKMGNNDGILFSLIALDEMDDPIHQYDNIEFDGHNEYYEIKTSGGSWEPVSSLFSPFALFQIVEYVQNFIFLTEKGKAFVSFLRKNGFILDKYSITKNIE